MNERYFPYLFFLPSVVFLVAIVIYPMLFAFDTSFRDWLMTNPEAGKTFVGLENYKMIMHDPRFWSDLGNTLYYTVLSVSASFSVGLGLALLMNGIVRGRSILRIIFLIPMVMTPIVVGFGFRFMFNYELGVLNYLLSVLGLPRKAFLGDPSLALNSIILVDIWQWTPFMVLVLLAGLESLPKEPFEAARIDGAPEWQVFRHITLPLMKPVILVALLIRTMDAMRDFDKIYVMTAGGPGIASETLSLYDWKVGFSWWRMGYASALGLLLLFLVTVVGWSYVKLISFGEEKK